MEESILQQQALRTTEQNMLDYFKNPDLKYVAKDAVYRNLSTGEVYTGHSEIGAMLHFMYHVAFDAKGEVVNTVVTENKAVIEAYFKGRHVGEIAGIKATEKEVDVPMCVSYDLENGLIKEARIYFMGEVMMNQLGNSSAARQKTSFVVRDIFQLKFGHFRPVKELLKEAMDNKLMPDAKNARVLTDFTGDSYRLILESGFDSLLDFEASLSSELAGEQWQAWYRRFMDHVESSYREILKQIF